MAKNLVDGTSTTIEENGDNISIQINFPIGYIYMSTNSTNPSTYFGGTWERIAKGKTLVGVDENDTDFASAELTGGEKTHTLTVNEMPSHNHTPLSGYGMVFQDGIVNDSTTGGYAGGIRWNGAYTGGSNTSSVGGGQAHNNLQPYFTCYIWEKVGV